jgi:hypothetical protein
VHAPVLILANGDTGTSIPTAGQLYIDGALVVNNDATCSGDSCYGDFSYVQTTQDLSGGSHDLVRRKFGRPVGSVRMRGTTSMSPLVPAILGIALLVSAGALVSPHRRSWMAHVQILHILVFPLVHLVSKSL